MTDHSAHLSEDHTRIINSIDAALALLQSSPVVTRKELSKALFPALESATVIEYHSDRSKKESEQTASIRECARDVKSLLKETVHKSRAELTKDDRESYSAEYEAFLKKHTVGGESAPPTKSDTYAGAGSSQSDYGSCVTAFERVTVTVEDAEEDADEE